MHWEEIHTKMPQRRKSRCLLTRFSKKVLSGTFPACAYSDFLAKDFIVSFKTKQTCYGNPKDGVQKC